MSSIRDRLRALPSIVGSPPPDLPSGPSDEEIDDAASHPRNPLDKFQQWLLAAIEAGIPEPHAITLSTVAISPDGTVRPDARVLIIKDLTPTYVEVAFSAHSAKGQQVARERKVALSWYASAHSRAVRIRGEAVLAPLEVCEEDWRARAVSARAVVLAGRESGNIRLGEKEMRERIREQQEEVMKTDAEGREVGAKEAGWQVWRVRPDEVEFWQGRKDRLHERLVYSREATTEGGSWRTSVLWP